MIINWKSSRYILRFNYDKNNEFDSKNTKLMLKRDGKAE